MNKREKRYEKLYFILIKTHSRYANVWYEESYGLRELGLENGALWSEKRPGLDNRVAIQHQNVRDVIIPHQGGIRGMHSIFVTCIITVLLKLVM